MKTKKIPDDISLLWKIPLLWVLSLIVLRQVIANIGLNALSESDIMRLWKYTWMSITAICTISFLWMLIIIKKKNNTTKVIQNETKRRTGKMGY